MKVKSIMQIVTIILTGFFLTITSSFAANFTTDISGLTHEEVVSATVWFEIGSDFELIDSSFNLGDAVPNGTFGWEIVKGDDSSAIVEDDEERGRLYKVDIIDYDNLLGDTAFPLDNGTIFTFDYTGTITGLSDIIYLKDNNGGDPIDLIDTGKFAATLSLDENSLSFAPVPIPGAIWLFCSGLIGLAGLRRKIRK